MRLLIAASLLLLPAYAANAQLPAEDAKPKAAKKICKIDEEDTGSRLRRRICKTAAEWNGQTDDVKTELGHSPKIAQ